MRPKPHKIVYDAWRSVNLCCDVGDGHEWETCLVHIAKDSLYEFNMNRRNVDIGKQMTEFPKDDKEYDIDKLKYALGKIDKICAYCEGYHNEACPVSNARKSIELLIFGKFHVFQKLPFGEYLVQKGIIDKVKVTEVYELQREINLSLPSIAIAMEFLTPEEALSIINKQKSSPKEFEEIAVEKKYLSDTQLKLLTERQKKIYKYIGDIFVAMGYLTNEQKESLLKEFKSRKKM